MTRRRFLGGAIGFGLGARARADTAYPPLGRFVAAEGLRIHALERGAGPAVVLIHGASGNLRDFAFSMMDRLAAAGVRAVAFDRPGLGYSDRAPERGWEPAVQARVLRAAAAGMGVERPVVVGHSWGAAVAMAWALQDPKGTAGAVSLAGATYPWGSGVGTFYQMGASEAFGGLARSLAHMFIDVSDPKAVLGRIFDPDPVPPGYADFVGVPLALRPGPFRHNAEDLKHLDAALARQAPNYAGLETPVEVVHGLADNTVWARVHAEPLARAVSDGRLTLLPGVGHMPHHAEEAACVEAILRLAG